VAVAVLDQLTAQVETAGESEPAVVEMVLVHLLRYWLQLERLILAVVAVVVTIAPLRVLIELRQQVALEL
jgi:hypothetical protein